MADIIFPTDTVLIDQADLDDNLPISDLSDAATLKEVTVEQLIDATEQEMRNRETAVPSPTIKNQMIVSDGTQKWIVMTNFDLGSYDDTTVTNENIRVAALHHSKGVAGSRTPQFNGVEGEFAINFNVTSGGPPELFAWCSVDLQWKHVNAAVAPDIAYVQLAGGSTGVKDGIGNAWTNYSPKPTDPFIIAIYGKVPYLLTGLQGSGGLDSDWDNILDPTVLADQVQDAETARDQAQTSSANASVSASSAASSAVESEHWAQYPEDQPVPEGDGTEFSSYHWSKKSQDSVQSNWDETDVGNPAFIRNKPVVVLKTSDTGSAILPTGTTAERDGTPALAYLRYNTDASEWEYYDGAAWTPLTTPSEQADWNETVTTDPAYIKNKPTIHLPLPAGVEMTGTLVGGKYTNNSVDTAHDIDFAAGAMMDSTNQQAIKWSAMTKQGDAAWAAGDNAGMMLTGTLTADKCYLIFALYPDAGGDADFGCLEMSQSIESNLPAGYTKYAFFGLLFTNASTEFLGIKWVDDDTFEFDLAGGKIIETSPISTTPHVPAYSTFFPTDRVQSVGLWGDGDSEAIRIFVSPDGVNNEYNIIYVLAGSTIGYLNISLIPLNHKIAAGDTGNDNGNIGVKRIKLRR